MEHKQIITSFAQKWTEKWDEDRRGASAALPRGQGAHGGARSRSRGSSALATLSWLVTVALRATWPLRGAAVPYPGWRLNRIKQVGSDTSEDSRRVPRGGGTESSHREERDFWSCTQKKGDSGETIARLGGCLSPAPRSTHPAGIGDEAPGGRRLSHPVVRWA